MPDKLIARYLAPYVGREGLNHLLTLARAIGRDDMDEVELTQLDQPTLIIWGDQDRFIAPKLADDLADAIPGSRVARLPGAGRLVPEESPETVATLILDFIGAGAPR